MDDTLLIMDVYHKHYFFLKSLLNTYAMEFGLKVNYSKSSIIPINVKEDKMSMIASTFNCQVYLSFSYLGLPLGIHHPRIQDCMSLIHRVQFRLSITSGLLSQGGKLQLVNSVLSSLPTYFMSTFKLPIGVINQTDKFRRHYIWRGYDINANKPPLASWNLV